MTYTGPAPRTLLSLGTLCISIIIACNPGKGEDTSASESAGTTSAATSSATSSATSPTTSPTTDIGTTDPGTTSTTSLTTGDTADTTGDSTTGVAVGCGEDPDFAASWSAWQAAVEVNGPTYYYSVLRGVGGLMPPDYCIYRTLIVVSNGIVTDRHFEIDQMVGDPQDCETPFFESGAEVGTNVANFAAVPATVDTLYGACCDQVIHIEPAEEYMITFEVDKQGLMAQCFYVPNGCADGCDSGPLGDSLIFETLAFGPPPP